MAYSLDELRNVLPRMIKTSGWLYMIGASTLVKEYGPDGEMAVREWLRTWGDWRGKQLRKAHMAIGHPINMESLCKYWDSAAATGHLMDDWINEGSWHPSNVRVPVKCRPGNCPISEPWRENNFWQMGHVLCDEFHIHFVRGYHPDAVVVIPKCIMKRDELCDFNFVMPQNAKEPGPVEFYPGEDVMLDWETGTDEKAVLSGIRRKTRITAGRIYFLWKTLNKKFPESARSTFKSIMEKWADSRSEALGQEQKETGWNGNPADFYDHLDHPYGLVWGTQVEETQKKLTVNVDYCPFAETWKWLGDDGTMSIFCETCYPRIGKNNQPALEGRLDKCMCKGDDSCRIRISKK
jgi:hypothetical protein